MWGRGDPAARGGHPGITWDVFRDTGGWQSGATLPSLLPGMCQQLQAVPHAPADRYRCGAACWNLLLLGGLWAEESWHRAGQGGWDVLWWGH